jgi:uncharacterized cupin superfamily protein
MPPTVYRRAALSGNPKDHRFVWSPSESWTSVRIGEWELTRQEWVDTHEHDEFNYVLEGTLMVTCDGETVEVPAGNVVHTPPGSTGRYWAPVYARMLVVYGPNPTGAPTIRGGVRSLGDDAAG